MYLIYSAQRDIVAIWQVHWLYLGSIMLALHCHSVPQYYGTPSIIYIYKYMKIHITLRNRLYYMKKSRVNIWKFEATNNIILYTSVMLFSSTFILFHTFIRIRGILYYISGRTIFSYLELFIHISVIYLFTFNNFWWDIKESTCDSDVVWIKYMFQYMTICSWRRFVN